MITDEQVNETLRAGEKAPKLRAHGSVIFFDGDCYAKDEMLHLIGPEPNVLVNEGGFTRALISRHASYIASAANHFPALWERCKRAEELSEAWKKRAMDAPNDAVNHIECMEQATEWAIKNGELRVQLAELEAENMSLSENYSLANEGALAAEKERDDAKAECEKLRAALEEK